MIPKPGGGERALGIPTIRDRVAQTAVKLIMEPIFETDLEPNAFGYRPNRSAQDAIQKVDELLHHPSAGDLHPDPAVDPFALHAGDRAPLDAANYHSGPGIVKLRAILVGADFGEQFRVDLRQVHVLALRLPAPEEVPHGALGARPTAPFFVRGEPHLALFFAAREDRYYKWLRDCHKINRTF
jgi:hypothetical protein